MVDIFLTEAARADFDEIDRFGRLEFGDDAADDYGAKLLATIDRLTEYPELGPIYPGLRPAIRFLTYRRHHIFYEHDEQIVRIVRILHHALDVRRAI